MAALTSRARLFMALLLVTASAILVCASLVAARLRQGYGEASPKLEERRRAIDIAAQVGSVDLWIFDRLDRLGDHPTTILGNPRVVETPVGKAVEFDGVDDALVVDVHPLAGAETFTWEAIFRPDGGQAEQRWFHLQESGSDNRMLFEIRVIDGQWYLDSYGHSGDAQQALMDRSKLHPLGAWYHVAAVYDGRTFSNYVNGTRQGVAEIRFAPQGPGRTSIGVRMNLVNYFKGAIHVARFTRRALSPAEFLKIGDK